MKDLKDRLNVLCDIDFDTLDSDETQHGCLVEMNYDGSAWTVWLTDDCGSCHTAVAVEMVNGEFTDKTLITGPSFNPFWGESCNEFSVRSETLEDAVFKLEEKVAILKKTPNARLIFTWDD